ncbi:unnamed protein product [Soboliphyme baturini]|uniref:Small ribosomal subunit protein bS6m n=1 Tax=Soboliphyme baturini TaxID=241478 RepID=A0A183ID08_9BILA|nr:unnamed protein product [Soboliphyme baturini]
MPLYELTLIFKPMLKDNLASTIKRCCVNLMQHDAIIVKLQSLGYRDLPYKMSKEHQRCSTGRSLQMIDEFGRDSDVLHYYFHKVEKPIDQECTLAEELEIPAYRKSVEKLRKKQRLCKLARIQAYLKAQDLMKRIPKSFPVAPVHE